jgi:hypothetical protein
MPIEAAVFRCDEGREDGRVNVGERHRPASTVRTDLAEDLTGAIRDLETDDPARSIGRGR